MCDYLLLVLSQKLVSFVFAVTNCKKKALFEIQKCIKISNETADLLAFIFIKKVNHKPCEGRID